MKAGKLILTCLLTLSAAVVLSANEPDYLRLGMRPFEAASVYTALRSCSNAPFFESRENMSWEGSLYNGYAIITLRFDEIGAVEITYLIRPATATGLAELFQLVVSDRTKAYGKPDEVSETTATWQLADSRVVIEVDPQEVSMKLFRTQP